MKLKMMITVGVLIGCMNALALSPPQYTLWRQIANSFGTSPCVEVKDIYEAGEGWNIDVIGSDADVCKGLAYVLQDIYNYGGIQVNVRVLDAEGQLYVAQILQEGDDAEAILKTHFLNALRDNPYFIQIIQSSIAFYEFQVWMEFKPVIIQYFNDNIGDFYGNSNEVAANVFREVCRNDFGSKADLVLGGVLPVSAGFTTARISTVSQASLYRQYP